MRMAKWCGNLDLRSPLLSLTEINKPIKIWLVQATSLIYTYLIIFLILRICFNENPIFQICKFRKFAENANSYIFS